MIYPLIALRGITVFPGVIIHFDLNRKKSIAAVNFAMQNEQEVVVCCQKQTDIDDPGKEDLQNHRQPVFEAQYNYQNHSF